MGNIKNIAKWNNENNKFDRKLTSFNNSAFSLAYFDDIIVNDDNNFDYIFFSEGSQLKDLISKKNSESIDSNIKNLDVMFNYFSNKKHNVKFVLVALDTDAPINEDSKLLAETIDNINDSNVLSINLVGISKSGAMMFNSIKYMKNKSNLKNINLFTISTPFLGSPLASPKVIFPVIKRVAGPIGIYWFNSVSSRNHLDFDIAVSGGMTEEFMDNYDPNFIKNILSD